MISHLSLGVSNLAQSAALYDAALGALGYVRVFSGAESVGYGPATGEEGLALKERPASSIGVDAGFHLAFVAPDRAAVDAFHAAALAHGATDDGSPGPRPDYGDDYYAAFVIDLDGHRLEVKAGKGA